MKKISTELFFVMFSLFIMAQTIVTELVLTKNTSVNSLLMVQ